MRDQVLASLKTKGTEVATDGVDAAGSVNEGADPAQASMLAQVQSQLRSNQSEIKNREDSIAAVKVKVNAQSRLNQEPVRDSSWPT